MKTITEYIQKKHVSEPKSEFDEMSISSLNDAEKCINKIVDKYTSINERFEQLFVENYDGLKYFVGVPGNYDKIMINKEFLSSDEYTTIDLKEDLLAGQQFAFRGVSFINNALHSDGMKWYDIIKKLKLPTFNYSNKYVLNEKNTGGIVLLRNLSELDIVLNEIAKIV